MQNANRRRLGGHWYTTTFSHKHKHTRTQERGDGGIIEWREWKWSCSTENRGPQLFVPCCISLSETPANTRQTHTHTSPLSKAVCIHFTHAAQKKRGIEILRQCRSPASRLVCAVILRSSWAIQVVRRHLRGGRVHFPPAVAKRAFPYVLFLAEPMTKPGLILSSTARLCLVHLHLFLSGCGAPLVCACPRVPPTYFSPLCPSVFPRWSIAHYNHWLQLISTC